MNAYFDQVKCGNPGKLTDRMSFSKRNFQHWERTQAAVNRISARHSDAEGL